VILGAAPFVRTTTQGRDRAVLLARTRSLDHRRRYSPLTPPAGSAGAGNSPISGVPFGPANPRGLSDPSGIGNASLIPPLRANSPPPPVSYGSVNSSPPSRTPLVAPPYAGASQRIISAHDVEPRSKAPFRRRGRA
jgi:hypothetical protein